MNIAARIAALAGANEILLTAGMIPAAEEAGAELISTGKHSLQGIDEPVALVRIERGGETVDRDPVCGMVVGDDAVARLRHDDVMYAFCSPTCLRKFLEDPPRYASVTRG